MNSPASPAYFSESEINDVMNPYFKEVRKIPGLIDIQEITEGNVKSVKYIFDTAQNMANSKSIMVGSDLAKRRTEIIRLAMLNNNISPYSIETIIDLE